MEKKKKLFVPKYRHLLGKDLLYFRGILSGDTPEKYDIFEVHVVQIDYAKGITIKYREPNSSLNNNENNARCINRKEGGYEDETEYNEDFCATVREIEKGKIVASAVAVGIYMNPCAF